MDLLHAGYGSNIEPLLRFGDIAIDAPSICVEITELECSLGIVSLSEAKEDCRREFEILRTVFPIPRHFSEPVHGMNVATLCRFFDKIA
ncbi:MAG TPA: hypothetical protein VFO34_12245 [Candidatus Acidoferrales bacterium]|nr:hypothetical protein [Candidatus Acidoferrales bacterium]